MATQEEVRAEAIRRGLIQPPQVQASQPDVIAELQRRGVAVPQQAHPAQVAPQPTAVEAARAGVGLEGFDTTQFITGMMDPDITDRSMFLPTGVSRETGETVAAVPGMLLGVAALGTEIATSLATFAGVPGEVARGREFGPKTATEFAFTFGAPGLRTVGATKTLSKFGKLTKAQVKNAPDAVALKKQASRLFEGFKNSGTEMSSDDFFTFLAKAEDNLVEEAARKQLHPKLFDVMNVITQEAGKDLSAKELLNIRRIIATVGESTSSDELRLGRQLLNEFDDFVVDLPGTAKWTEARKIYFKGMKSQRIDEILDDAANQASGVENGLRIGLRSLLKKIRTKKVKGFSKDEVKVMNDIVQGDFTSNTLKKLSRFGFGVGQQTSGLSGLAGVGVGGGVGSAIAGPVGGAIGAAVPAVIGRISSRALEKRTVNATEAIKALIAGEQPQRIIRSVDVQRVPRAAASIAAGTQLEEEQQ